MDKTVILLIIVISIPDENKSTETVLVTMFYMHDTKTLDNLINRIAIALGSTDLLSHLLCVIHIKERFGGGVFGMLSTKNLFVEATGLITC